MTFVKHTYGTRKKEFIKLLRKRLRAKNSIRYYLSQVDKWKEKLKHTEEELKTLEETNKKF